MNRHYQEIAEKRKILRDLYGGMMTLENIREELGYKSRDAARAAAAELGIEPTKIGKMKKYETDIVAKRLVELRGVC